MKYLGSLFFLTFAMLVMGYFIIGDLKILTPPKSFKQNLID